MIASNVVPEVKFLVGIQVDYRMKIVTSRATRTLLDDAVVQPPETDPRAVGRAALPPDATATDGLMVGRVSHTQTSAALICKKAQTSGLQSAPTVPLCSKDPHVKNDSL
jgi:hypothetical protein